MYLAFVAWLKVDTVVGCLQLKEGAEHKRERFVDSRHKLDEQSERSRERRAHNLV